VREIRLGDRVWRPGRGREGSFAHPVTYLECASPRLLMLHPNSGEIGCSARSPDRPRPTSGRGPIRATRPARIIDAETEHVGHLHSSHLMLFIGA
jgi:hypothetical protein